ncbi:ornithine decarboxylase-like [Tropilaelaps mercedesae]|uniref:Ornithine decarboxylase-like n=1 Tax=Tropilaelaps mercedesae TaxID=418985 RepID=A0A1V9X6F6_9ACAR|nr:ornithine decarboxylase-like [Tropilaelaps mercedesae]
MPTTRNEIQLVNIDPWDTLTLADCRKYATELIRRQDRFDEAFFICDLRDAEYKCRLWKENLPRVTPFYAVKSNADPLFSRVLFKNGVKFDCSNQREIRFVLDNVPGVQGADIIVSNTSKCRKDIAFGCEVGANLMTVDSLDELEKILPFKDQALLLIRLQGSEYTSKITFNRKFGASPELVTRILRRCHQLGLNVVGTHFHVGLGFESALIYDESIKRSKAVFDEATEMGFNMRILNLGGSFPGGVRKRKQFLQIAAVIQDSLARNFPIGCGVQVIAEPGQFFSTSAWILCTKVVAVKDCIVEEVHSASSSIDLSRRMSRIQPLYKMYDKLSASHSAKDLQDAVDDSTVADERHVVHIRNVFLNESRFNVIPRATLPFLDLHYYRVELDEELANVGNPEPDAKTVLWGATCNPFDQIVEWDHAIDFECDQWILIDNMGAYSRAFQCGFNGFGAPPVYYLGQAAHHAA